MRLTYVPSEGKGSELWSVNYGSLFRGNAFPRENKFSTLSIDYPWKTVCVISTMFTWESEGSKHSGKNDARLDKTTRSEKIINTRLFTSVSGDEIEKENDQPHRTGEEVGSWTRMVEHSVGTSSFSRKIKANRSVILYKNSKRKFLSNCK